ncbi:hypothetical protein [Breznakia pachnodae]|uniref:Alpha-L-rhamnosidase-like protein n=1 Tax=Breznakia pachnodae TaxID=265178 RepID=A0ABU0E057_9FIRM|nr:hypothetical protein [Breznakia pachnodae]MDQ0360113.1 hypothetical protein [Breznakia pachnodae]
MKKIIQNIENRNDNYLYPFFWQHGESDDKLIEYIEKIYESGIHSLCIESRPHPEFLEDGWWKTMTLIIDEAKKRDMKIWILDDAKFPTGYANGKVPNDLKKRYLNMRRFDIVGPLRKAEINMMNMADFRQMMKNPDYVNDEIYKVILAENSFESADSFKEDSLCDVTEYLKEGMLTLDLDAKHYSIFVVYKTTYGGEETTKDYLDPTRKEATQILLNEVYEKHYEHFKDDFGKTIVGFFSDEPRFGNIKGTEAIIGKTDMVLPWNDNIQQELEHISDTDLVFLFKGKSEQANNTRFEYMNVVSQLYSDNFSKVLGNWCKEKGVDYVGHVIEDNNVHARLGYGPGHYFRGIAGQSMAGIDVIGGQIIPGMDYHHDAFSTGGSDGEFYHYALCKMGASAAKLEADKRGILMCEAFGAYGWVEGLKMMKWITNHMLAHGVNLIVPHAFDPKEFPDWDCPPHFYANGNNPQFPYFHYWSGYTNRLCNLLNDGYQKCEVGVLYHAFAEWSGGTMYMQKVLKELQQHQIDCNVISEDYLNDAQLKDGKYYINGFGFHTLIVPAAKQLPDVLLKKLEELSSTIEVIFTDYFPGNITKEFGTVLPLSKIAKTLKSSSEIKLESDEKNLTFYHYVQEDGDVFLFNNEDIMKDIHTTVSLKASSDLMIYDAYENRTYQLDYQKINNEIVFDLHLKPYEMLVLVSGMSKEKQAVMGDKIIDITNDIEVSLKAYTDKEYSETFDLKELAYFGDQYPRFSGNMKYRFTVDLAETDVLLQISEVYEIVEVIVNGKNCGVKIAPEYVFDISKACEVGNNTIEIIVTNNLSRNQRDAFSQYLPLEPMGIVGTIGLYKKIAN